MPTKPTQRFPYLYYWNASSLCDIFGRPLPLTCVVDISEVIDKKCVILNCHQSQQEWLTHHNKWDYIEIMKSLSREEGQRVGFAYGEGFIQHLGTGHPRDNFLKTIFAEACVEMNKK